MSTLTATKSLGRLKRLSAIHSGPGVHYDGTLPVISLARGSPRCWGPPLVAPGWIGGDAVPYPPPAGLPSLRRAVGRYLSDRLDVPVDSDEVFITNGATQAIDVVSSCLRSRKVPSRSPLRVLFLTPTWMTIPFNQILEKGGRCGQIPASFEAETGTWSTDLSFLELALRRRPDAVFIVYPSNPTGRAGPWLGEALALLDQYGVPGVLDVTYESMRHDGRLLRLPPLPNGRRNLFLIGSLSKRYAIPGLRTAYLVPPSDLGPACEERIELATMGVSVLSQAFALQVVEHDLATNGTWFAPAILEMARRCDHVRKRLTKVGFTVTNPEAGYYVFARIPERLSLSGRAFRRSLFAEFGVDTVPGDEFGDHYQRFIRMSVANPFSFEEVEEACNRVEEFVQLR